ncbi:MAG: hypothetical protein ACFHWZ_17145 [Phycisphaerales bacterium]
MNTIIFSILAYSLFAVWASASIGTVGLWLWLQLAQSYRSRTINVRRFVHELGCGPLRSFQRGAAAQTCECCC